MFQIKHPGFGQMTSVSKDSSKLKKLLYQIQLGKVNRNIAIWLPVCMTLQIITDRT